MSKCLLSFLLVSTSFCRFNIELIAHRAADDTFDKAKIHYYDFVLTFLHRQALEVG